LAILPESGFPTQVSIFEYLDEFPVRCVIGKIIGSLSLPRLPRSLQIQSAKVEMNAFGIRSRFAERTLELKTKIGLG